MSSPRVDRVFERRLAVLIGSGERGVLQHGLKGVEKESLRVTPGGRIATTRHPEGLGSALTNEHITTDYSEALVELITPAFRESWELLAYLCDIHQYTYRHLGDELLWATSMPCAVRGDDSVPIAEYGSSNLGRLKTVYRVGLALRYGRVMQAISGVHFNYSFPQHFWPVLHEAWQADTRGQDFVDEAYFALLRNYHRHGWILNYLFGVSPALCRSFFHGREIAPGLEEFGRGTLYGPYATTLRMSDLGYRNKSQAGVRISLNSRAEYVRDLARLMSTPHPEYQRLGTKRDGHWQQLNTNVLQIENEYYSFIRPKRVARSGERPTKALTRAGVEYVEMRSLDVSAFDPVGVNQNKLRFLEAFAALCVLKHSDPLGPDEIDAYGANHVLVARRGREPGLVLADGGRGVPLDAWGRVLLDEMQGICELLDAGDAQRPYTAALEAQREKFDDVAKTPSARLLNGMRTAGEGFFELALRMSATHKAYFLELHPPDDERLAGFHAESVESLAEQRRIEAGDRVGFDEFVAAYLAG
ncbi:MAG: glutamate--cysteine ligase [Steroidobacteraceae bacterium]